MAALKTQNALHTAYTLRADVSDYVRGKARPAPVELDERAKKALADVRRDGFAIVENFWPQDKALAMRDKLEGGQSGVGPILLAE